MLPGTTLRTTALGFGSAEIFRAPTQTERRRLLETAYEYGIRHFDVARMYGLGSAEKEIGHFARGRRGELILATKFGIAPTRLADGVAKFQKPVRRLLTAIPSLRDQARSRAAGPRSGRAGAMLYRAPEYHATSARSSLERSLRELGTEYVDLFLLHEPGPEDVQTDDVSAYLESARDAGLVRAWGVSGEPGVSAQVIRSLGGRPEIFQVRDDVFLRGTVGSEGIPAATITFGALSRALPRILQHVTANDERRRTWSERVGVDCGIPEVVATLLLRWAMRQNDSGVVIFGTVRPDHIRSAVEAGAAGGDLESFLLLVNKELSMTGIGRGQGP